MEGSGTLLTLVRVLRVPKKRVCLEGVAGSSWSGTGRPAFLGAPQSLHIVTSDICLPQSIIRVVFHDRRLQYTEHQQLEGWRWSRPGDRILDIGESPQPVATMNTWAMWGFFVNATWNYAHREAQHGGTCMQSQHWRWLRQRLMRCLASQVHA